MGSQADFPPTDSDLEYGRKYNQQVYKLIKEFTGDKLCEAPSLTKYRFANGVFLVVVAGTELDMFGVVLGMMTYTTYGVDLLTYSPIFFGLCFLFPLLVLMWNTWDDQRGETYGPALDTDFLLGLLKQADPRNPHGGTIRFRHWVPGLRFLLLVLPGYTAEDVSAIFRINSLSTFTFGLYQVFGILATFAEHKPITGYVYFNIGTQLLNVTITVLFYATGVAKWMGNAATAQNLVRTHQGIRNYKGYMDGKVAVGVVHEDGHSSVDSVHESVKRAAEVVADHIFPEVTLIGMAAPAGRRGELRDDPERARRKQRAKEILCQMDKSQFVKVLDALQNQALNSMETPTTF